MPNQPKGVPWTIETAEVEAKKLALAWSSDATLFAAGMQVNWSDRAVVDQSNPTPEGAWIVFTFSSGAQSGGDGASTLTLLIDSNTGFILDNRLMKWSWAPERTVDPANQSISSTVALLAAELWAGTKFRAACPEYRHLSRLSLSPQSDDGTASAMWVVSYEDERSLGIPSIEIKIDASSGQVIDQDDWTDPKIACTPTK